VVSALADPKAQTLAVFPTESVAADGARFVVTVAVVDPFECYASSESAG